MVDYLLSVYVDSVILPDFSLGGDSTKNLSGRPTRKQEIEISNLSMIIPLFNDHFT
jgi:hypothetical protein